MNTRKLSAANFLTLSAALFAALFAVSAQERKGDGASSRVESASPSAVGDEEEKIIRRTYAKLTLYNIVERYDRAKSEKTPINHAKAIHFQFRDFHTGPISEIYARQMREVIDFPSGNIIHVSGHSVVNHGSGDEDTHVMYHAEWANGLYASGPDRQITVGEDLTMAGVHDVGKYTSYTVTASLEGKSRTYKALVIWHEPFGSSAEPKPQFIDTVTGFGGRLDEIFDEKRPPVGAKHRKPKKTPDSQKSNDFNSEARAPARSSIRSSPHVRDDSDSSQIAAPEFGWNYDENLLNGNGKPRRGARKKDESGFCDTVLCCPSESSSLSQCCVDQPFDDVATPVCDYFEPDFDDSGLVGDDLGGCAAYTVKTGDTVYFPGPGFDDTDSDFRDHDSGSHWAASGFYGTCTRQTNCDVTCQVKNNVSRYGENGTVSSWFTFHFGATNSATSSGTGAFSPQSPPVTCSAAAGYGFKQCSSFSDCRASVSLSVSGAGGGASFSIQSNADLWTKLHTYTYSCSWQ